jgi:hypothetical protein
VTRARDAGGGSRRYKRLEGAALKAGRPHPMRACKEDRGKERARVRTYTYCIGFVYVSSGYRLGARNRRATDRISSLGSRAAHCAGWASALALAPRLEAENELHSAVCCALYHALYVCGTTVLCVLVSFYMVTWSCGIGMDKEVLPVLTSSSGYRLLARQWGDCLLTS